MVLKKNIIVILAFCLAFGQVSFVHAQNEDDSCLLQPYEEELEKLNEEWGTNYKIQVENACSEQEMIEYFTSMSLEEFEEYIKGVHEADMAGIKTETEERNINDKLRSLTYSQYAYYDGNNALRIQAEINTSSSGVKTYDSIPSYGYVQDHYPYYDPRIGATFTFSSDRKIATGRFKCIKYIGKNITDGVYYTITCKFNAANTRGSIM